MQHVRAKQGHIRTSASLNDFSSSSKGSKRRNVENNISATMMFATGGSDKKRSGKDKGKVRELTPSSLLETRSESTLSSPKRFFTDDGEELVTTAIHLSCRQASLEQWRRLIVMEKPTAQSPPEAKDQSPSSLKSSPSSKTHFHSPSFKEPGGPKASQESYGGGWLDEVGDDVADELLAGGSSW
jgi:hypothetical protein